MASYSNSNGASSSSSAARTPFGQSKLRDNYPNFSSLGNDDSSLVDDCVATLRQAWHSFLQFLSTRGKQAAWEAVLQSTHQLQRNLSAQRIFSFPHALVLVWVLVLLWGEHWVFHTTVERCDWDNWEKWVSPHLPVRACLVVSFLWLTDHPSTANRGYATSSHIRRRPAADRPPLLPWPAVASKLFDHNDYRQLHAPILQPAAEAATPGHHLLPRRPVRWRKRVEDIQGRL